MRSNALLEVAGREQSSEGAFRSLLHWGETPREDWNCFTTGLVLRHLRGAGSSDVEQRAFDFLLSCRAANGAFSFWGPQRQPAFIQEVLPADADDSAIAALELAKAGRLSVGALRSLVFDLLLRYRLRECVRPAPPWLRPGVFLTWLDPALHSPVVDCCVNANIVALLAYAGLTHLAGYVSACQMIEDGIRWASGHRLRARSLTPYYPEPRELRFAVAHAVRCGARALAESDRLLRQPAWTQIEAGSPAICSSAYGDVVWTSPLVVRVREHQLMLLGDRVS